LNQQSIHNPSTRRLAKGKTRDPVEDPEALNDFFKVVEVFRGKLVKNSHEHLHTPPVPNI
jgi:hypothetical protein